MSNDFIIEKIIVILIGIIVLVSMVIIQYFINNITTKGIVFGVRIPFEFIENDKLKLIVKEYKNRVKTSGIISVIIYLFLSYIQKTDTGLAVVQIGVVAILLMYYAYEYSSSWRKVKSLKKENKWTREKLGVVVVDTTIRKPSRDDKYKPLNWKWFLALVIIPIITVILTFIAYDSLPNEINIGYNNSNSIYTVIKGSKEAYIGLIKLPITQLGLITLFVTLYILMINSKVDLKSGKVELAIKRKKRYRVLIAKFMFIICILSLISLSLSQTTIIYGLDSNIIEIIISVVMISSVIIFTIYSININGKDNFSDEEDELYRDDDKNWKLGLIYYNPNDPSIMVEKRGGLGYTINFGNKWAILIFIVIISISSLLPLSIDLL